MNNYFVRTLTVLIASLVIFSFIVCSYAAYIDDKLEELDNKQVKLNNGSIIKDQGLYLLQRSIRKGDLLLIGSSELSVDVPQNPINMYPNSTLGVHVNKIGSAYKQSLLDAIMLGALDTDEDSKIAVVVSLQWFYGSEIDKDGTNAKFSELQFWEFMHKENISEDKKRYVCDRIATLIDKSDIRLYAKINSKNNILYRFANILLYPYYECRYQYLKLKDKKDAYEYLLNTEECNIESRNINWKQEYHIAGEEGKNECTNNSIYVHDEYYDKYIKEEWERIKDSYKNVMLLDSQEADDYKFLCSIIDKNKIPSFLVFMSTNGWYYDYIGIKIDTRIKLYNFLGSVAEENNIDYLDLRDKEYEPYFYRDVMHLGRKGWTYVNEKISDKFRSN